MNNKDVNDEALKMFKEFIDSCNKYDLSVSIFNIAFHRSFIEAVTA